MGALTFMRNFIIANTLTLVLDSILLGAIGVLYLLNLVGLLDHKDVLEPPKSLTDPKYGEHKYIKANNVKLHYVSSGDTSKPLMLFLHGFPELWYSWRHQIVEFNKDFWCVAVDMRGYGESDKPKGVENYKLDILVDDVRDLIKQLGRDKCVLVSHDWGGIVAAKFRDVYPDMLIACIVTSSISIEAWHRLISSDLKQTMMSWYIFSFRIPGVFEWFVSRVPNTFNMIWGDTDNRVVSQEDIDCYTYYYSKPGDFTPPINYYRSNFTYTMPEKKRSDLNVPYLYAQAENDPALSLKLSPIMREHYAHIETTVVEGCRHSMQQENPETFNKLLRDFLKKHAILEFIE